MTEGNLTTPFAMRTVYCFLITAVVSFSSCTKEPVEVVSPTVADLGFDWQVPYATTLRPSVQSEVWSGTAVWIDRATLMLSFNSTMQEGTADEEESVSPDLLSYAYDEDRGTVRVFMPEGHVELNWDGTRNCFEGEVLPGNVLTISRFSGDPSL